MRPCDCPDERTVMTELNEQGIGWNSESIDVRPGAVYLIKHNCQLWIPMEVFTKLAEYFLTKEDHEDCYLRINHHSINLENKNLDISSWDCTFRYSPRMFRRFATWYLTDQKKEEDEEKEKVGV